MKKYLFGFLFVVLFSVCGNFRQADAYSVTVEGDSMYAEVLPPNIMENVGTMFQKQVKKAMKYHNKYKDADNYTYITKIPDKYRDFIEKAKEIQENDEIVIRYPFFIYDARYDGGLYDYYFIVEKNHERLCVFSIYVDDEDGKISFKYDKAENSYMKLDQNISEETLFYKTEDGIYAETPEQTSVIRTMGNTGNLSMEGNVVESEDGFQYKSYEKKKELIFKFLDDVKNGKVIKKSYKSMQAELGEDYQQSEGTDGTEDKGVSRIFGGKGSSGGVPVGIALVVGILCIVCAIIVGMVVTRQKQE